MSKCSLCPHLPSDAGHSFDCERPWQLVYKIIITICTDIMLFVKDRGARNFTINGCVYIGISPNLCPYKDGLATGWTARGSKCSGGKRFSLFNIRPDWLWAPPCLLYNAPWGSFPGVKQPDRVVDQKPHSSLPCLPAMACYGVTSSVRVGVYTTQTVRLSYSLNFYVLLGSPTP
jgi:hypothetical protein